MGKCDLVWLIGFHPHALPPGTHYTTTTSRHRRSEKVRDEGGLELRFTPSGDSAGSYAIAATGRNKYGEFTVTGTAKGRDDGTGAEVYDVDLYREYIEGTARVPSNPPKAPKSRPAKKEPRAAPVPTSAFAAAT